MDELSSLVVPSFSYREALSRLAGLSENRLALSLSELFNAASSPRSVVAAVPCLAVRRGNSVARPPVRAGLHRNTVVGLDRRGLTELGVVYTEPLRFSKAESAPTAAIGADPQLASVSDNDCVLRAVPVLAADAFWR